MRILIICTGNTCRSQMVEGFLKSLDPKSEVFSAGVHPEDEINRFAVSVMKEINVDISRQKPKSVNRFVNDNFDFVITVCDYAVENCPVFNGIVKQRLHISFEDPARAKGDEEEILQVYRKKRDAIIEEFSGFYVREIQQR